MRGSLPLLCRGLGAVPAEAESRVLSVEMFIRALRASRADGFRGGIVKEADSFALLGRGVRFVTRSSGARRGVVASSLLRSARPPLAGGAERRAPSATVLATGVARSSLSWPRLLLGLSLGSGEIARASCSSFLNVEAVYERGIEDGDAG